MTLHFGHRLAAMSKSKRRRATSAAFAAAMMGLAGCGGSGDEGTIPSQNADELLQQLSLVETNVADGNCTTATTEAQQFVLAVNALPKDVGAETKEGLRDAGENLVAMTQDPAECEEAEEDEVIEPDTGATGLSGEEG